MVRCPPVRDVFADAKDVVVFLFLDNNLYNQTAAYVIKSAFLRSCKMYFSDIANCTYQILSLYFSDIVIVFLRYCWLFFSDIVIVSLRYCWLYFFDIVNCISQILSIVFLRSCRLYFRYIANCISLILSIVFLWFLWRETPPINRTWPQLSIYSSHNQWINPKFPIMV